ncbi:MmyB family transcriptional regulator [Streptomyces sp. NBC_00344]|uniref:MmyB family transcriptional regulator n=1 Tax=Streptomyces sp. NBC_00344 TaxID=2975720 RepID=UPI002E232DF2
MILGRHMSVLAWNTLAALYTGFAALPPVGRNLLRLAFLDPAIRDLYAHCHSKRSVARAHHDLCGGNIADLNRRSRPGRPRHTWCR